MALDDEQAIIVDENDTIIRYSLRKNLTQNDLFRIVAVWIEDERGNALLHQRSKHKATLPLLWENAAGGGVKRDQTYEDAAYAELAEELGIQHITLEFVQKTIVHTPQGPRMCAWFKGVLPYGFNDFTLSENEVAQIKWVNKEKVFSARDTKPTDFMPSSAFWRTLFG